MNRALVPVCGLDFGTSNSTAGLATPAGTRLVALEEGKPTLPSAVFFPLERKASPRFGRAAITGYVEGEEGRLMRALKSVLGTSLIKETTQVFEKKLAFGDILALFLGHIKSKLEAEAGGPLTQAVLGRPVFFVDDDPVADAAAEAALAAAARVVGFADVVFQYEPLAAALDYETLVQAEELALIVDIGGGTSDFSVVRVGPGRGKVADRKTDILANLGVHIGGTDFDRLFSMAQLMPLLGYGTPVQGGKGNLPNWHYFNLATWQRINQLYAKGVEGELRQMRFDALHPELVDRLMYVADHRLGHKLAGLVEGAKISLSDTETTTLLAPLGPEPLAVPLTRAQLEAALAEAVARVQSTALAAVAMAGVGPQAIDAVFLTGGSSQVPYLRQALLAPFAGARVVEGDMFGSVGHGLTLHAQRVFG